MKNSNLFRMIAPLALGLLALLATESATAAAAAPITLTFDHLTTGFELDGVHRDLPCEACHLNAVFKGTPRACGTCHITGSLFNATPKTATHIPSTNNCAACHNTISFRPDVHFDHAEVLGSCVSCHNGTIAQGIDPKIHPQTSDVCEACHTVMSWNPPKAVDHTQIPLAVQGFCIICHNGVNASGKSKNHVVTTLECGDCHLTTTWKGANFDHTGIKTGCSACHNGVRAVGKQGTHMPTTNVCETCHTTGLGTKTPSWAPSKFDHTQMTVSTCVTCHSGTVKITTGFVSTMPVNHVPPIPSIKDCSFCHGNNPSAETWDVLSANIATLHSGLDPKNCLMCHAGQTFAGKPAPYIPMSISGVSPTKLTPLAPPHIPVLALTDCSACHGAAYQAGGFGPATAMSAATHAFVSTTCDTCHDVNKSFYTGTGTPLQLRPQNHITSTDPRMAASDCGVCHETKDWLSSTLPAGHMPNPSNQSCATCHAKAPNDYTAATLAPITTLHTGITKNCELCHGDYSTALTWANNFTPKDAILTPAHIPYLLGTDCIACHTTNYATGGFGPATAMNVAKHAFVPTACDTCHGAASPAAFYTGSGTPLQIRPTDPTHSTGLGLTSDCSACHNTTNWNSTVLPAGHMPNPGSQACTVCHIGDLSTEAGYVTLASIATLHTSIPSGSCAQCHGNYSAALTWFNNFTPKDAILTPAHIPYTVGTDCSSCHASTYATGGFGPTAMNVAKHAFVPTACDTCHGAASPAAFYTGTGTPLQIRPTDPTHSSGLGLTSDCSACHNTTNWNSTVLPAGHMPNPGSQACTVCHIGDLSTEAGYVTLASIATLHTSIPSGSCAQCHGNYSAALTWFNNFTPKDAILTPAHIPYNVGTDCGSCHASTYATGGFGPTAMSAAKHAFVPTACDTCHGVASPSAFYTGASTALQIRPANAAHSSGLGLTGDCSNCHNTANWVTTVLPPGHMPNVGNQTCTVCHVGDLSTQAGYLTLASVAILHTGIATGTCAQCHGNYLTALTWYNNFTPKDAILTTTPHIPYLNGTDCSACHTSTFVTGGFGPATAMSPAKHAFVPTACSTCHDTGKNFYVGTGTALQTRPISGTFNHLTSSDPVQATGDCSLCHNTTAWTTLQLPPNHMPNPNNSACTVCHVGPPSNNVFATNAAMHTGIANGCAQCHGGATNLSVNFAGHPIKDPLSAATLASPHIPAFSNSDCSACHSSTTYAAGAFGPMNMTQASHTSVGATCNPCHGVNSATQFYMGAASPGLQIRPADHTVGLQVAPNDCSLCHTTANWISTVPPSGHMPNPGNQTCNTCHTAAPTNYPTLASFAVLHTAITKGQCSQCHGLTQLSFFNPASPNSAPKSAALTPSHIPFNAGTDCSSCHTTTTYAAGTFGPMNMTQASHTFVSTTCDNCHGVASTTTFFMGSASPILQIRPPDHTTGTMLTGDCSACHTTANWNTTVLPSGHMPNPGNQACSVCHIAIPTYSTLAANAALHTGITAGQCSQCHGLAQLSFFNPTSPSSKPKSAALTPSHIPFNSGTDCSSCHTTSTYAAGAFGPMNMTQATHAFVSTTCDTCHGVASATTTFYMGSAAPILQIRPADHLAPAGSAQQQTSDCSACHNTASWATTALPGGHMPNPGNQNCAVCHVGNLSTAAGYATLAANSVLHTGIASGQCAQCHGLTQLSFYNPTSASSKPKSAVLTPVHIAFNAGTDCGSCHKTTTYATGAFGPMIMSQATHAFVSTTCDTCHGVSSTTAFYTTSSNPLQIRPTTGTHVSGQGLTGDCSGCHNTASWATSSLPTGHMPNPASQACSICHIAIPTYTTLAANSVLHTGVVAGQCAQCHGFTTALTWYNNFTPKDAVLSPAHIPINAGLDCSVCHATTTYAAGTFGPMDFTKGTKGSSTYHTYLPAGCNTCHEKGVSFYMGAATALKTRPHGSGSKGAPNQCNNSGCHNTSSWNAGAQGAAATKTRSKIASVVTAPTTAATATAAVTRPILGRRGVGITAGTTAALTHAGITGNCVSCHNGVLATGKGPTHVASNTACQNCHTTVAWLPARFDHQGVTASCASCHNGVVALGKPATHIQTSQDCSTCHGTIAWIPVNFSHVGLTATCQSCHNGITAVGKQPQHVITTKDCSSCHNVLSWTVVPTKPLPPLVPKLRSGVIGGSKQ